MRRTLAATVALLAALAGCNSPVEGDPKAGQTAEFTEAEQLAGLKGALSDLDFPSDEYLIKYAKGVCTFFKEGETVVTMAELITADGYTVEEAGMIIGAATRMYCQKETPFQD